jgi:hypothetical protein
MTEETPVKYQTVRIGGDDEQRASHPSWVMVGISRQNGHRRLFGSQLQHHQHFTLSVQYAEAQESLGGVHYFGTHKNLIEVTFSGAQFVELITSMNIGSGVPGTLTWYNGEFVPQAEENSPHPTRVAKKGFTQCLLKNIENLQVQIDEINALIGDSRPLGQEKKKQIRDRLSYIKQHFVSNADFYLERYKEAAEEVTKQAKNEFETFVTSSLMSKGIEALRNEAVVSLPKGEE